MARQFNGTSDELLSASAIDLSAYTKGTVAFWLWWDVFANDGKIALAQNPAGSPVVVVRPNDGGSGQWQAYYNGNVGFSTAEFTRPSAAAWHHYCLLFDITKASAEMDAIYLDGVSQTLNHSFDANNTGNLPNGTLYLMSSGGANFGAGRLAEVAVWGGLLLSQSDVSALYNSGNGALATSVQSGSLTNYWRILGDASPEPATVGSVNLTVTGTVQVAHPFTLGGLAARRLLVGVGR